VIQAAGSAGNSAASDPSLPTTPTETVVLPVLRHKVEPRYPEDARQDRIEGKVTVQAVVLRTGHTAFPMILASSNRIFDRAAREAIAGWRYEPARQNGRTVAVYYTIVVEFLLSDSSLSGPGRIRHGNRPR
jgi:protein TonB